MTPNTIELLDERQVPRLRMAPPYLVDAVGRHRFLTVSIEGCAVDTSATPPWEHAPVPPRASKCLVRVEWDREAVQYPLVVDPSWSTTGNMIVPRFFHTSTTLNNGRVLVSGGTFDGLIAYNTAELFEPALGVWIAAGPMVSRRWTHTSTLLSSGRVLSVGGWNELGEANASGELYHPSTGVWLPAGTPGTARAQHTATLLSDQTVLIAGGAQYDSIAGTYTGLTSCQRYFEATNSWSSTGGLVDVRSGGHTANLLANGAVLAAGGYHIVTGAEHATAELYDPTTGTWSLTGAMSGARVFPAAAALPGNKILVAGGARSFTALASAEIFDPGAGSPASGSWAATSSMATARAAFTATKLPGSGRILAAGGATGAIFPATLTATAELYDPTTSTWLATPSLNTPRSDHTASLIGGGVLVAGGTDPNGILTSFIAISDAEIYQP